MDNRAIGVFDSGIGGLTVLEKIYSVLPNEEYLYLADQINCPYGTKEKEEIEKIVINNAKKLEEMNVKCIVVACNTASLFIDSIQKNVNIPVFDVISHTCEKACSITKKRKIGVIATNMTIKTAKYQELIQRKNIESFGVACSEFVDFLEYHFDEIEIGKKIVKEKMTEFKNKDIDTLIYGCTHFGLLHNLIKKELGNINYVDCGEPMSAYLKKYFDEKNMHTNSDEGLIKIYTTGDANQAVKNMSWFKIEHEKVQHIDFE